MKNRILQHLHFIGSAKLTCKIGFVTIFIGQSNGDAIGKQSFL